MKTILVIVALVLILSTCSQRLTVPQTPSTADPHLSTPIWTKEESKRVPVFILGYFGVVISFNPNWPH